MSGNVRTAEELDARILQAIEAWSSGGAGLDERAFDRLALDLFAYQFAHNEPYRRFVTANGEPSPQRWQDITPVPSSAFKDATLTTFDVADAALEFHTSGTTASRSGKHYFERAALYDAALLAGFDRFMLADGARLAYLNIVPDPASKPHSSLGYMMRAVGSQRAAGEVAFYLHDDRLDVERFVSDLERTIREGRPVCVAATAFGFVAVLDALAEKNRRFVCAPGSRVMETGGFKGRTRAVDRDTLYSGITERLGVPRECVVAEYGMTELTSQYYDSPSSRSEGARIKAGPPWLRALVVDDAGREVPRGAVGSLRHVDLANRSSVIAIQTEDRGYATDGGFVFLGRDLDAPLRGCSLDAEELAAGRG